MANPNFKENPIKRFIAKSLQPILKVFSKRLYISLQYRYITGHKLNWNTLELYTEKLQYLRLYIYPKLPNVIRASGRRGAREYVEQKGLKDLLIPSFGIYSNFNEIDFASLPNQFVMKATHGSGMNYICFDKHSIDYPQLKKKFTHYLKTDYGRKTVEPHYSKIKKEIIIEKFIGEGDTLPREYKIHVFNGRAKYLYVVSNRGKDIRYDNYYIDWTPFPAAQFNHWKSSNQPINPPQNWDKMVKIAELLGNDFPFVRIDMYEVNDQIYFGEFTFTPAKGTLIFDNKKADIEIGSWLDISAYRRV